MFLYIIRSLAGECIDSYHCSLVLKTRFQHLSISTKVQGSPMAILINIFVSHHFISGIKYEFTSENCSKLDSVIHIRKLTNCYFFNNVVSKLFVVFNSSLSQPTSWISSKKSIGSGTSTPIPELIQLSSSQRKKCLLKPMECDRICPTFFS